MLTEPFSENLGGSNSGGSAPSGGGDAGGTGPGGNPGGTGPGGASLGGNQGGNSQSHDNSHNSENHPSRSSNNVNSVQSIDERVSRLYDKNHPETNTSPDLESGQSCDHLGKMTEIPPGYERDKRCFTDSGPGQLVPGAELDDELIPDP